MNQLETKIKQSLQIKLNDSERKEGIMQTADFVKEHVGRKGKVMDRCSFWSVCWMQLRMGGWRMMLVQGMIPMFLFVIFQYIGDPKLMKMTPRVCSFLICLFSISILGSSLPFLYRSIRCQMWEVEAASRFSTGNLLLARMMLSLLWDGILFITGMAGVVLEKQILIQSFLHWGLVPLLAGTGLIMAVTAHGKLKKLPYFFIGFCAAVLLTQKGVMDFHQTFVNPVFEKSWIFLSLSFAGIIILEARKMKRNTISMMTVF